MAQIMADPEVVTSATRSPTVNPADTRPPAIRRCRSSASAAVRNSTARVWPIPYPAKNTRATS